MCCLISIILAFPSTISQYNCHQPAFSHLDPQINLNKTWLIFLMQESGNIIGSLADFNMIFGTIMLLKTKSFPSNNNALNDHIFNSVLILSLIDEKF